jgi:hypothetical protein
LKDEVGCGYKKFRYEWGEAQGQMSACGRDIVTEFGIGKIKQINRNPSCIITGKTVLGVSLIKEAETV